MLIFLLELEISGLAGQRIHQSQKKKKEKNGGFCEDLLIENDFETVLVTFCCYDDGGNASEAVRKIATDQKELSQ